MANLERDRERKPNRLISEKSPYLLEHAYNPVDWYPWGEDAFKKARDENKPIFLSIGYSACHWCHVFRKESFEDPDIAKILNDNFVPIKVDREARPDVDDVYMKSVMSMTGSGGWPLSVFLTPDLKPFYGGTYFPPIPRGGMPSFPQLLKAISRAWNTDRTGITKSAKQLEETIRASYELQSSTHEKLTEDIIDDCFDSLAATFDDTYGGFGGSPKFPTPSNLFFLFRYYLRTRTKAPLIMALKTLDAMGRGGIRDHIGGGFHRYSVDREWIVPHFEKMLYDNALLCAAYIEAFQITKREDYRRIAEEILEWAAREMTSQTGGFFSAIDADSPQGEGAYYVWNRDELLEALQRSDIVNKSRASDLVCTYYGISDGGNFENASTILTTGHVEIKDIAKKWSVSVQEVESDLRKAKRAMLFYRKERPAPKIDDKILVAWNGLMVAAYAKAHEVFGKEEYLQMAIRASEFLLQKMTYEKSGEPRLRHWFRDGEAIGSGNLEDYSFVIFGLIELYEASFKTQYLSKAIDLARTMISKFYDSDGAGGFFFTEKETSDLIVRPKDAYDGAIPSGNSVAILSLLKLAEITNKVDLAEYARKTLVAFRQSFSNHPTSYVFSVVALDYFLSPRKEVVLAGSPSSPKFQEMQRVVRKEFLPHAVVAYAESGQELLIPLIEGRVSQGADARAYVCSNYACKLPSANPDELVLALEPLTADGTS